MDHARKIGKTETPFLWTQKPSPPSSICDRVATIEDDEDEAEDRRLVNWRKWLDDREKHYQRLEKYTGRDRKDLLMTRDDYRQTVEMRNLIEGASDSTLPAADKYRGNPAFWITPEFLPKRGNPELPDIAVTLTKKQLNVKPVIERIALPELIKREKGLPISDERATLQKSKDHPEERGTTLSRKINYVQAKEPEISRLAIKGQKLEGKLSKKVSKIPNVTIESLESFRFKDLGQPEVRERQDAAVLIVQDREIRFEERATSRTINHFTWSLIFYSSDFNLCRREIRLEIRGNCAITYRWRYGRQDGSFVPPKPPSSAFFFNKNKGLLLPGQVVKLPVWFRSREPGVATEIWTLTTEPPVTLEPLVFRFWGSAIFSALPDSDDPAFTLSNYPNPGSIERYLNRRIRDAEIHEIVQSLIEDVPSQRDPPSVPYSSLFVERDIFRATNPIHFYHFGLTRDLGKIHQNATSNDSPSWNLSLMDLRSVLLAIEDSNIRNETMLRFNELCRESLEPSLHDPMNNAKILMVYNLLCSFANKFEEESDRVADQCPRTEILNGKIYSEVPGNATKSTSATSSQVILNTPRRKTRKDSRFGRSRTTSTTRISTTNNRAIVENVEEKITRACILYNEVFHVRIRELLSRTIVAVCAIVDTINHLNPREK